MEKLLYVKQSSGRYRPASSDQVFNVAAQLRADQFPKGRAISAPREAHAFLREHLAHMGHEEFVVMFLDTRHRLIQFDPMFRGTIDGAAVYPREIVKKALIVNAAAVVLAHNHPSGDPEPSEADRSITVRVSKALALVDVRLLDHLVIGGDGLVSLAEKGWI